MSKRLSITATEDLTDEVNDEFLLKPTRYDLIPFLLAVVIIILGLTAGLVSFFMLRNQEYHSATTTLNSYAVDAATSLTSAGKSALKVLQSTAMFFQVSKTPITLRDQLAPFIYSDGSFPKYLSGISYGVPVLVQDTDAFIAKMRAMGGDYTNFTIFGRDQYNHVIPPSYVPIRGPVLMTVPVAYMPLIVGLDTAMDPYKNETLTRSLLSLKPAASGRIVTALREDVEVAVAIFVPIINTTSSQSVGMIGGTVLLNQLIIDAISPITKNIIVSVMDMNATADDPYQGFVFSTAPAKNNVTILSYQENAAMIQSAEYNSAGYFTFVDRTLKVVLIPTKDYEAGFDGSTKWIALILSLCFMLMLLIGCIFLYFSRKLVVARQKRVEAGLTISILKADRGGLRSLLERIATQEHKSRCLVNAFPDAMCMVDSTGKIVQTNAAFDHDFPFTQLELEKGVHTWDIFNELASDFYKAEEYMELTTHAVRKNAEPIEVSLRLFSLQMANASDSETGAELKRISHSSTISVPTRSSRRSLCDHSKKH
jgi:CHASE1-domain containing sensor protein